MTRRSCDGPGLLAAFRAAVANLEAHVAEIDGLNVYPVPDGDTGSNMLATVRAALDEAEKVVDPTAARIATAISFGALMGARGNSGVITSQIFRGMAEGFGGKRRFNGLDLAHALRVGAETAYAAVLKPVEGTILTVVRDSADAAIEAAERTNDLESVLATVVDAAGRSVARTPAGRVLSGCSRERCGRSIAQRPSLRRLVPAHRRSLPGPMTDSATRRCSSSSHMPMRTGPAWTSTRFAAGS